MHVQDYFKLFENKSEKERLDIIEKLLIDAGYKMTIAHGCKGTETYWFDKADVEYLFALSTRNDERYLPMILPRKFVIRHYAKDGVLVKSVGVATSGYNKSELCPKFNAVPMYYEIYEDELITIPSGMQVDHITHHRGINIIPEMRICTPLENSHNTYTSKWTSDEYAYNPLHDFRDSFYIPFLHYVLGVISYTDMHKLRGMELQ